VTNITFVLSHIWNKVYL